MTVANEHGAASGKPTVLVLASTYPRWENDHEPAFVHELCRRLTDRFQVIAVVPDAPGAAPSGRLDGVDVMRFRYAPRRLQTLVNDGGIATNLRRSRWKWLLVPSFVFMQYVAARRVMRRRVVDVVHAHWLISPGVVARAASGRRPYVVTSHGGDLFGFRPAPFRALKRWVAANAAAMSVVSEAMRHEVVSLRLPVSRVDVIPMGVDIEGRFAGGPLSDRSASELLFVGRLVAKKGLRYLIEAMPAIVHERPDVILRVVGFGPERESLEALSRQLGMASHVVFAGAMSQSALPTMYRHAALFVAPFVRDASGDQEGLPVALMEAVAMGCPFVVGEVPGLDDLLGPEARPYRVDPAVPGALTTAVLACLADPSRSAAVAAAAKVRAASVVDWNVIASRYASLLAQVLSESRP